MAPRKKPAAPPPEKKPIKISQDALIYASRKPQRLPQPLLPMSMPPGVIPKNVRQLALDSALSSWAGGQLGALYAEGLIFMSYAELSEYAQRAEYRRISEVMATEMTRKWIKLQATNQVQDADKQDEDEDKEEGDEDSEDDDANKPPAFAKDKAPFPPEAENDDEPVDEEGDVDEEDGDTGEEDGKGPDDDKTDKINELEEELDRLRVRDVFCLAIEHDGFFGCAHIYLDTGQTDERDELVKGIGTGGADDKTSDAKFKPGSLEGIRCVEPMWCYPATYEATDPLKREWYRPQTWWVMGKELSASRLLTFVGREVPDMLKPTYGFGGLSLTQMAKPYIDNFIRTRQSVSDLIHSFSVSGLKTELDTIMQPGNNFETRADLFNHMRDNRGLMVIDKNTEDFWNISTPLSTLDTLQAQSQEQIASVVGIPLVKLLGTSPVGLNASSEGEIRVFYDWINAFQEKFLRHHLQTVIHFAMRNIWGKVDEDIEFVFEPLYELSEKEDAEMRKTQAETHQIYVDMGAVDNEEVRTAIAGDPETPYQGIDPNDVPEPENNIEDMPQTLTGKPVGARKILATGDQPGGPVAKQPPPFAKKEAAE